jgi:cation transport ATPase
MILPLANVKSQKLEKETNSTKTEEEKERKREEGKKKREEREKKKRKEREKKEKRERERERMRPHYTFTYQTCGTQNDCLSSSFFTLSLFLFIFNILFYSNSKQLFNSLSSIVAFSVRVFFYLSFSFSPLVHLFKTDLFTCSILSIPSLIE